MMVFCMVVVKIEEFLSNRLKPTDQKVKIGARQHRAMSAESAVVNRAPERTCLVSDDFDHYWVNKIC